MIDGDKPRRQGLAEALLPAMLRSHLAGYLFAFVAVALCWLLQLGLTAWLGEGLPPYIAFYPAVMLAALLGGWGPGAFATGLIVSRAASEMWQQTGGLAGTKPVDLAGLVLFVVMCLAIVVITERYRRSLAKAAAYDCQAASRAACTVAERALQHSEERYHMLLEQAADGIFVVDADGRYLEVNAAGAQMLGYSQTEILARRLGDFISAEESDRLLQVLGHLAGGAVLTSEWCLRRKDGSSFFGQVVGRQLPDGTLLGILRDVSESRRLENERRRERALLDSVMGGTDVMLVYLDLDFNFVWVNQAYADGCHMDRQSMVGKNHFALYPDAENEASFRHVRDTGEPVFYKDKPFAFADRPERGTTYWDWSLAPDKDAEGQVVGLVFSLRQTTKYVRAQLAVRESEARFTALANAAPVLIWMSDPDARCIWFNQQWLSFTGRTMEEASGNGWTDSIHPDDIGCCLDIYKSSSERREPIRMEYRLRSASGEYRWLNDHAAPHYGPDGEFLGYIGTCTDITERRVAEDLLIEAQTFATGTIDAISAHLCVLDKNGRILAVNQAWSDFFDRNHPEPEKLNYFIGANYLDICDAAPAPVPADMTSMAAGIRQVISGELRKFSYEYPCHGPDQKAWFVATVTRFHGDSGNVVVAHKNVTEQKKAEDAAKAARAEAEQANNAKSRFLAAASHDLRQPLSALGIYLGVLKNSAAPADVPLLNNMTDCVTSLSELLADLLDISKLEAGVVVPEISEFSVAELLAGLVAIHEPEASLKGVRLRAVASRLHARTDAVLFRRILGNLIANAVRYTERGGIVIGCRRRQGKHWIEVWDSGIGISADKTAEIFEEFRQLDQDVQNRGSGLGLAIVAKSAALLGLEIDVRSWPGKGSVFALALPLGEKRMVVTEPKPVFRALRVAVVDDNAMILHAMVCALEGMGHHVTAGSSGMELFERLGERSPDILVSDFRLARGETGFDVIKAAKARFGDDLPALLMTGDTDPKLIRSMADRGIIVQHKPVKIEALQACFVQLTKQRKPWV